MKPMAPKSPNNQHDAQQQPAGLVGYAFRDAALFTLALTHRSALAQASVTESNERMEYLGDAVVELVVTDHLYHHYPDKQEGEMTTIRSALVSRVALAQMARDMGLPPLIRMSRGEESGHGREKTAILSNICEAVLGAIYLDGGIEPARDIITRYLLSRLPSVLAELDVLDMKSLFQEKAQGIAGVTPRYKMLDADGPEHDRQFTMAAMLGDRVVGQGTGSSKKRAEVAAAEDAVRNLGWLPKDEEK